MECCKVCFFIFGQNKKFVRYLSSNYLVEVSLCPGLSFRIKAFTVGAVVCVDVGTTAISSIPFTIFGIENTVVTIVISMPARWLAFQTITILAIVVPSLEIIEATSSTIKIAVSVVVLVITVAICGPMRGSAAGHWWFGGGY